MFICKPIRASSLGVAYAANLAESCVIGSYLLLK